jgi:hypothetical protein
MPLNDCEALDVEAGCRTGISLYVEVLREIIMASSWQRIVWKWRRRVAAKRLAAEYGEDVPLGIG